jgi:TolB-like protein
MPLSENNRDTIVEFAVAESLILKMSTAPNFYVRPFSAVRKYVELDRDPIEAGKELNADYVLSSNYQIIDGRIRVTSQLFDTRTGKAHATFTSESDAHDKFIMQDKIANEIGNAIFASFGHRGSVFTAKRGTANEEAYRLYLQGQYLVDKKTRKDAERAIQIFDQALALDPNFAHAWAGKAGAHCTFAHMGGIAPNLAFVTAKPALSRAFELDPNLAEAHAVRGIITFDYDWDFDKGLQHFRKALQINPQHEMARRWYANRLGLLGRYDEALTEIIMNQTYINELKNHIGESSYFKRLALQRAFERKARFFTA